MPIPLSCPLFLREFIHLGRDNNPVEVRKLQAFLNVFEGEHLPITGFYSQADFDAVSRFQGKYLNDVLHPWGIEESTGYVFITTRLAINNIFCGRSTANDLNLHNYYPEVYQTIASQTQAQDSDVSFASTTPVATSTSNVAVLRRNFFQAAALGFLNLFKLSPGKILISLLVLAVIFVLWLIWRLSKYPDTAELPPAEGEINEIVIEDDPVTALDLNDEDPAQPPLDNPK